MLGKCKRRFWHIGECHVQRSVCEDADLTQLRSMAVTLACSGHTQADQIDAIEAALQALTGLG